MLFLTIVSALFVFSRAKDTSRCFEFNKKEFKRTFTLSIQVKYNDGTPYNGAISFKIFKTYCDQTQSGVYTVDGNVETTGFWRPGATYTYSYGNSLDVVKARFTVYNPITTNVAFTEETFTYDMIEGKPNGIEKTYQMTLPRNDEDD